MGITQSEFARKAGCSRQYVNKLVKQGKLTRNPDGSLDEEKALAEYAALAEVGRDAVREWNKEQRGASKTQPTDEEVARSQRLFNSAKAREKSYLSLLRELEYKVATKEYVRVSDVEAEAERVFAELNSILNALPSRLAPKLMQRESLAEIQRILEDGINQAKITFQDLDFST